MIVVASKAGAPEHSAWFHNARAHPEVQLNGRPFRAKVVEDEAARERLWELADRVFPALRGLPPERRPLRSRHPDPSTCPTT